MSHLARRTILGFAKLIVGLGLFLFLPAWTLSFWQAWVYLFLFTVSAALITGYLWVKDPQLLERRVKAGLLLGIPSIALSQAFSDRDAVRWDTARQLAPWVIRRLLKANWADVASLNVNFPDVPAESVGLLTVTRQGQGLMNGLEVTMRVDPRGGEYGWLHIIRGQRGDATGSETEVIAAGGIAVTPLQFERTAEQIWSRLTGELAE
jgi:hypothetical protein